jgi:hypothetical protein
MSNELETTVLELSAFADDDQEVAVEPNGDFLLVRAGQDVTGRLLDDGSGAMRVIIDGTEMSYRRFITHHLARLDVFAERIIAKRAAPKVFVDGNALLSSPTSDAELLPATAALARVSSEGSPFATRVAFLTADAGHGKTLLLRELQHRTAVDFLSGRSPFLLWHVDLQGRQLVRLSEALMGDLGDLRISGLWMSAVLRLIRMRALVLAIDGFDELAAEQGSTDALGALATLVRQLDGKGVVVAASRRTFFDTEDYLARAGLIRRSVAAACQFDQVALQPWGRPEGIALLGQVAADQHAAIDAEGLYDSTLLELGGDAGHPMLTRPFLLNQLARAIVTFDIDPATFIRGMDDPLKGVAALVQAFIEREVRDKWIRRETGEPLLSAAQHMELLARVAEEMYEAQKDRLRLDVIETIASILLEQWGIDPERRMQAVSMVRMHVLLTVPPDGESNVRSFDHAEFRDYFIAYALRRHLDGATAGSASALTSMLRIAQITDSTAKYVCGMLDLAEERSAALAGRLADLCRTEKRMTFIPINVGTLLPFVLDGRAPRNPVVVDAPAIFSSLVFERTKLEDVHLQGCTFLNASLVGVEWSRVRLTRCVLGELTIDLSSKVTEVVLDDCEVSAVRVVKDGEEVAREFAPSRIASALSSAGFTVQSPLPSELEFEAPADNAQTKLARRLLRVFQRTTIVNEHGLQQRFRQEFNTVVDEIMPLLEQHAIVEPRTWHGGGASKVWALVVPLDQLLAGEEPGSSGPASEFWKDLKRA